MSLINKMNVGNTDYDIQDRLMPDAIGQAGQVLKVKDDGSGLEFSTIESGGEKVSLAFPAGASEGTITAEQLVKLQASESNYIEMVNDKELYYLNDPGHVEGYLTYSHVGIENGKATIKTLTITVSAKSFVIVTTVVPTESGGGKLYKHIYTKNIEISGDPKNTVGSINLVFYSSSPTQLTGSEYYNKIYKQDNTVRANCTISGGYLNYIVKQSSYMNLDESRGDYSIQVNEMFNPVSDTESLITPMLYYKEFAHTITEI